jgi:DNA-binding NarL/FixJ family response regulator
MIATVLIADDYTPFRRFVREMIQNASGYRVVAEASDGITTVELAAKLKPAIVLLDISMPWMSGFEAALALVRVSPTSKIVFITANTSPELAQRALAMGATGYLIKSHLEELLPALEAVMVGNTYVSRVLRMDERSQAATE